MPTNLPAFLIVVIRIWRRGIRELHFSDLQVVLCVTRGMGANEETMGGIRFVCDSGRSQPRTTQRSLGTYSRLSGSHCVVRVGHSNAVLRIMS